MSSKSFPITPPPPPSSPKLSSNFYQEFLDDESNFEDSPSSLNISVKAAMIQLAQASLLKLGALAAVHPFESMRLLRQVQYGTAVDSTEPGGFFESPDPNNSPLLRTNKFTESSTSNDADDEGEPLLRRRSSSLGIEAKEVDGHFESSGLKRIPSGINVSYEIDVDEFGYARPSKPDTSNSSWPLFLNKKASLWSSFMLAAKYQGAPSLWNGVMAFWAYQSAFDFTQAALEEILTSPILWNRSGGLLGYTFSNSPLNSFPAVPVTSSICLNATVNFLLTPLDLVRTRMVAQSIYADEIKCKSLTSAITAIYKEEGGFSGLYPNKAFSIVSAVLLPTLRILPMSLFSHYAESWIETFGVPPEFAYPLAQFIFSCTNLFIILPIETIKRRLFLQNQKKSNWIYRVPVSPTPYHGFWNCLRRICLEEGPQALYQGWSMQLASSTVLLASNLILEMESEFPDDMEAF